LNGTVVGPLDGSSKPAQTVDDSLFLFEKSVVSIESFYLFSGRKIMKYNAWIFVLVAVAVATMGVTVEAAETDPVAFTAAAAVTGSTDAAETYGDATNSWSGEDRMRGNVFSVAELTSIEQIEQYLDVPVSTTLHFSVFRKINDGTLTGTYTRDFLADVAVTAAGPTFYSSGVISYSLDPTYYYYICAGWDIGDNITYYRGNQAVPLATTFGALETGIPDGGAGNPSTYDNTYTGYSPYYMRLTFTIVPVELQTFTIE